MSLHTEPCKYCGRATVWVNPPVCLSAACHDKFKAEHPEHHEIRLAQYGEWEIGELIRSHE